MRSDEELIERLRSGEQDAFAVLVRRYERIVRATAYSVISNRHAVEDVTQETFLAAFASLDSLRESAKFGAWLVSIARNQAAGASRKLSREVALGEEVVAEQCDGALSEQSEELLQLVARLPSHERVLIGLRYFEGLSVKEVAAVTGRPLGTVTKQLSRTHQRLERWFTEENRA